MRCLRKDGRGASRDGLLRLVLPHQLHEEGLDKKWRENGWLNHPGGRVASRDLWERLLEATKRHRQVRWRKVKGHSETAGPHKSGNDRVDELAVAAKKEAIGARRTLLQGAGSSDVPGKLGDMKGPKPPSVGR